MHARFFASHLRALLFITLAACWLSQSACESILLDERFNGKELLNWQIIDDPETIEGPSQWRVEDDGWLHQRSNIWGRRGDFLGRWYGTLIVAGESGWQDYTLTVKARPNDNDGFGVVFRCQDAEHFYRLLFIEGGLNGGPMARLDKRDGADYTELWTAPRGYSVGQEMRIAVDVHGDMIRASINGQALCEVKDTAYRSGKVGLFCYAQNEQAFDDVLVIGH